MPSPPYGLPHGLPNSYWIARQTQSQTQTSVLKYLDRFRSGLWLRVLVAFDLQHQLCNARAMNGMEEKK